MEKVRIGIIGIGVMGSSHAKKILNGAVPRGQLTAVCDIDPARLEWAKENLGEDVAIFDDAEKLMASGLVDGVMIATPHYDHPPLAIKAFEHNLHVLIEKPAGVYTKQVREMNAVAAKSDKVFGIMYNQRTNPMFQKIREMVKGGELGDIKRTCWIITTWYRTQPYYDSGGWRGTWAGEGGGVLINQDPHQLDLWQWICGRPVRVRAFAHYGKYHNIEVEDDVTAYVEYENGATGTFITSTGEDPGTNRFEIMGTRGKLVLENNKLTVWRLPIDEREHVKVGKKAQESVREEIQVEGETTGHMGIFNNWVAAILDGTPLLAPGEEGINGLEISNAMHLSSWLDDWVTIPVDEDLYYEKLQEKIANSTFKKKTAAGQAINIEDTGY